MFVCGMHECASTCECESTSLHLWASVPLCLCSLCHCATVPLCMFLHVVVGQALVLVQCELNLNASQGNKG